MSFFRQGLANLAYGSQTKFLVGCILVSSGVLLAAGGGSWDITNHLLNRPETFFAPPHLLLYSGVGAAVAGAAMLFTASRRTGRVVWPAKLAIAGVVLLVSAGPVDFAWHSNFGLDGLMSPPHFVLVSGMVASSLGGLAGMAFYGSTALRGGERLRLHPALVVLGVVALWLSLSGLVDMLTLPFSDTDYFDFDPDPAVAVALATILFPLVIAACLCGASFLSGRRFGAMSLTGAAFVGISMLSSIVPSESLQTTIPFYVLTMIPIVVADAIMSYRFWRPFAMPLYAAGAILGVTFFMLYYPLITHTYNEFIDSNRIVWASVTAPIYFEMIQTVYPLLVVPSAAVGTAGAIVASRLTSKSRIM
ncbi:MAG TPA: hypothetical protein VJL54_01935 [Nitrososphaera sp.]|nr:hypothetical protein [Nitrososphaera sp.]